VQSEPPVKRKRSIIPISDSSSSAASLLSSNLQLSNDNEDYTIGWICALDDELAAARAMLDEVHPGLSQDEKDSNAYTLGRIAQHNVAIACLPSPGTSCAAIVAANMLRSFPRIRFGLMVGIGCGALSPDSDIRLGDVVVVSLLLHRGADPNLMDPLYGLTPLSGAAENGHQKVVKLLLTYGADTECKDPQYHRTPLWLAVNNNHRAVVSLLLENKSDPDPEDKEFHATPLSWASEKGYEGLVRLLIEHGAEPNGKVHIKGGTPLSWATINGHERIVVMSLERGADPHCKDGKYRNLLFWLQRKVIQKFLNYFSTPILRPMAKIMTSVQHRYHWLQKRALRSRSITSRCWCEARQ
jgi:ankyrin repeat protein